MEAKCAQSTRNKVGEQTENSGIKRQDHEIWQ